MLAFFAFRKEESLRDEAKSVRQLVCLVVSPGTVATFSSSRQSPACGSLLLERRIKQQAAQSDCVFVLRVGTVAQNCAETRQASRESSQGDH